MDLSVTPRSVNSEKIKDLVNSSEGGFSNLTKNKTSNKYYSMYKNSRQINVPGFNENSASSSYTTGSKKSQDIVSSISGGKRTKTKPNLLNLAENAVEDKKSSSSLSSVTDSSKKDKTVSISTSSVSVSKKKDKEVKADMTYMIHPVQQL